LKAETVFCTDLKGKRTFKFITEQENVPTGDTPYWIFDPVSSPSGGKRLKLEKSLRKSRSPQFY
jgi:hypothetical protein